MSEFNHISRSLNINQKRNSMKNYLFGLVITVFFINIPAMGQNESKELYESRVKSFSKMKSGGIVLTLVGGIFTGVGTALLVTAPDYTYDYYGFPTNEDEVTLHVTGGIVCLALGIDAIIGGIVLTSIGSRKYKQYKNKLDNLSFNIIYSPKQQGFMLSYRF